MSLDESGSNGGPTGPVARDADVFFDLVARRRSARHFQDRPVPDDLIRKMIESAMRAPTACNRQLWHFVVVTEPEVKDAMSRLGDSYSQSYLYDAPAIIVVFYDTSMESRNPCHTAYVTTGMAIYAMLLAAEAQGLGAIYLGGIMDPSGIGRAVGAPSHLRNVGLVCVGYRDDEPPRPNLRSIHEVVSYNRCRPVAPRCLPDIRPEAWSVEQLADFRDKVLWYKGVAFDGKTLHVNPDPRFSHKLQYLTHRAGMMLQRRPNATVLDVLPYNGDLIIQLLLACERQMGRLYAYELTPGVAGYVDLRLRGLFESARVNWVINEDPRQVRIPLPDESVDLALCYQRLGQFSDPLPLLRDLYRVLRPGGTLISAESNACYPYIYWYKRMIRKNYALGRNWNYGPERKFSPGRLRRMFVDCGFRVRDLTGFHPVTAKLLSVSAVFCEKLGWYERLNRVKEAGLQIDIEHGLFRRLSQVLIHELEKV